MLFARIKFKHVVHTLPGTLYWESLKQRPCSSL